MIDPALASQGWRTAALEQIRTLARSTETAQLSISWHGRTILDEQFDPAPVDVYAVQKGLLTLLFGMAEEKYLLELVDHINHHLAPEWTQLSPWDEAKLTIETLLTMTTGMDDELRLQGEINKTWRYNNVAYNYLKKILCLHTGMDLQSLSGDWLLGPLQMQQTRWVEREARLPDGSPITGLLSTATDLVKLGQFILDRGHIGDVPLLPAHFIDALAAPGSAENPAWGYGWWNNNQAFFRVPRREEKIYQGTILPMAPLDLIAARGLQENFLHLVPSHQLIIARTRGSGKPQRFERPFWDLLVSALPPLPGDSA